MHFQQDAEGFIRMPRHLPAGTPVTITFGDGSTEAFTGRDLNAAYDRALAEFRAGNNLDAKGFSRTPKARTNSGNRIEFVRVHPDMARGRA